MLRILTNSEIDRAEWSTLVRTGRTGTWFQTPEAYAFFASLPAVFCQFAIAVANEGGLRGVCVGYATKENNSLQNYFSRRAIIPGGPCLADDCSQAEVEELMRAVREHIQSQAIYIETRNFNDYTPWREAFLKAGFTYQPHLNFHVDCRSQTKMDNLLSDNRKRQLRKACQSASCTPAAGEEDIMAWYHILKHLYRTRVKTPLFPLEFFLQAYKQRVATFLMVKHKGIVIGGSMLVTIAGKAIYEWFECGMNVNYREQYPSVMATYAGMQLAHAQGAARYDMMGAGQPGVPYGVRDFKAEFGGQLVEHGRFIYVQKPLLYKLGTFVVKRMKKLS